MSFGSILRASYMAADKRQMIIEVLESLAPVRVIWKWEDDDVSIERGSLISIKLKFSLTLLYLIMLQI